MATQIQFRRGTTAEHSSFTGAVGEITVDTTKDTAVIHDGSTAGGVPLAKESAIPTVPTITAFAETILDDADGAAVLSTLGLTATASELNTLDGITADVNELNILDGATVTTAELNILDGATVSTAELNYLDITALGTTEASKAVTADANGVVTFDNGKIEESTAITSSSNAATLDLQDGDNFTHDLTEDVTYTFSNPASSGKASAFTLKVTQDSTARTITWPASVDWADSTAPTLSTGDGDVDYFVFITTDGGTTYYGFTAGQAFG